MKDKKITVITNDSILLKTIEVEAAFCGFKTELLGKKSHIDEPSVLIIDLDYPHEAIPDTSKFLCVIGIGYLRSQNTSSEISVRCHYLLQRPFLLSSFRNLLNAVLSSSSRQTKDGFESIPVLDRASLTVSYCGESVSLSPNEAKILDLLLSRIGFPVSRDEMATVIGETSSNKADVYVCYLRKKLEVISDRKLIRSVRKIGYLINVD